MIKRIENFYERRPFLVNLIIILLFIHVFLFWGSFDSAWEPATEYTHPDFWGYYDESGRRQ